MKGKRIGVDRSFQNCPGLEPIWRPWVKTWEIGHEVTLNYSELKVKGRTKDYNRTLSKLPKEFQDVLRYGAFLHPTFRTENFVIKECWDFEIAPNVMVPANLIDGDTTTVAEFSKAGRKVSNNIVTDNIFYSQEVLQIVPSKDIIKANARSSLNIDGSTCP